MGQYAIIGIAKLKTGGNIAGALDHMERKRKTENSNGHENDILIQPPPLPEIMQEINSYLPRKNAVLAYDVLLTASPEWFTGKTEEQVKEWEAASLAWAQEKFGNGNIKAAIVHRDETTPHLQLLVIPEHENKLNARYYTGGREKMRQLWTEYAAAMKPYGLERGREYSPAKHQNIKAYYEAVNQGKAIAEKQELRPEQLPVPGLADRINPRQYAAELIEEATENTRWQNVNLKMELRRERAELERLEKRIAADRKLYHSLQTTPGAYQEALNAKEQAARTKEAAVKRYRALAAAISKYFKDNIAENSELRLPERLGSLTTFKEIAQDIRQVMPEPEPQRTKQPEQIRRTSKRELERKSENQLARH